MQIAADATQVASHPPLGGHSFKALLLFLMAISWFS